MQNFLEDKFLELSFNVDNGVFDVKDIKFIIEKLFLLLWIEFKLRKEWRKFNLDLLLKV